MIEKNFDNKKRLLIALILIGIGSIIRITLHNNLPSSPSIYITINGLTQPMFLLDLFFVIALISMISGLFLGGFYTFIIPISIMIVTDILLGNNWILLFTWSGFALLGLIGYILKRKNQINYKCLPRVFGIGIVGILSYDIWTNFGTWLGGWYPHTWDGLIICYTKALPFMFWHLLSTTVAILFVIVPIIYLKEHKLEIPEFKIKPIEEKITFSMPILIMILALLSIII
jgi:hypothetical protein